MLKFPILILIKLQQKTRLQENSQSVMLSLQEQDYSFIFKILLMF